MRYGRECKFAHDAGRDSEVLRVMKLKSDMGCAKSRPEPTPVLHLSSPDPKI